MRRRSTQPPFGNRQRPSPPQWPYCQITAPAAVCKASRTFCKAPVHFSPTAITQNQQPTEGVLHLGQAPACPLEIPTAHQRGPKRMCVSSCASPHRRPIERPRTVAKRLCVSSSPATHTHSLQRTQGVSRTFAKRLCVSSCSRLACSLRCRSSSSLTRLRRKALRRTSTGRWFCSEGRKGVLCCEGVL